MRADWIRLIIATARIPLPSDPAKSQFDLPSAHSLIWFSTALLSMGTAPSLRGVFAFRLAPISAPAFHRHGRLAEPLRLRAAHLPTVAVVHRFGRPTEPASSAGSPGRHGQRSFPADTAEGGRLTWQPSPRPTSRQWEYSCRSPAPVPVPGSVFRTDGRPTCHARAVQR